MRDAQSSFEKSDLRLQRLKKKVASMGTEELEEPPEALITEDAEYAEKEKLTLRSSSPLR